MAYIGLIDCNNFFVSCERVFRPDLINKPVVVLSSNDGCVVARSQEVKDNNIPMGAPYFQVKDILSDIGATIFSSHFSLYRDLSRRVFEVAKGELGIIEQYSIDECFFNLDEEGVEKIMLTLKMKIFQQTGIPVSIGLAHSKTRAKYASHLAKKTNGVAILSHKDWERLADKISLAEIWGVGQGRVKEFGQHGLLLVSQYCQVPKATVELLFGLEGLRLQGELKGEVILPVERRVSNQKSYMSTGSFPKSTDDLSVIEEALSHHVYQIAKDLNTAKQVAQKIRVLIYPGRYSDYALQGASLEAVLDVGTNDIFVLKRQVNKLLLACFKVGVPYKRVGVIVSDLVEQGYESGSLFTSDTKSKTVSEMLISLNKKFGKSAVSLGPSRKKGSAWRSQKEALSPDYTTNWLDLRIVR